jgi:hydrogenase expression/formation protein HypE
MLDIGKLPNNILKDLIISKINNRNKDILVGPGIGEDCSVVDFGDMVCVLTTDPITAAENNAGTIGVNICCNDIASAGVKPLGILVTILAPPTAQLNDLAEVMNEVNAACLELGIDVLGGHTEITDGVNRIILSMTAIGKGKKDSFITTGGAKIGDDIVVTGYAGLEGTAILSKDYYDYLSTKLNKDLLASANALLKSISVVEVGLLCAGFGVNSMHDATEGGILGAIWEIAEAAGLGVLIDKNEIPIKEETRLICKTLNIDPYKLISSGSMIVTCRDGAALCSLLKENKINAKIVGKITAADMLIDDKNSVNRLLPPETDEIYRVKI